MTEVWLRVLLWATIGLGLVLLLRRPARRMFGAGPAFTLWLLPVALIFAPLLPRGLAHAAAWSLPAIVVTSHAVAAADATVTLDWVHVLLVLWLAGAAVGLARLVVHYLHLRQGAQRVPIDWMPWLTDAAPGLEPSRVRVHAAGPAVLWALPRALILLPEDFVERFDNAATRELVLRHELTHAVRGDAWWSLAMEVASALLWFHPLTWLARPRFRLDQELACDAAALRTLPRRQANYARALLDSVAVQPLPALIPWLAEPQLKERIAMITRIPPGALRRRAGFLAIAALLGCGLAVAGGGSPALAAAPHASTMPPTVDVTYKSHHMPTYPVEAARSGEQGTVILDVTVNAQGSVEKVSVDPKETTAPTILQTTAMDAAATWKFHPGLKQGHPVGGVLRIPVNFSLSYQSPPSSAPCPSGFVREQGKGDSFTCTATRKRPAST